VHVDRLHAPAVATTSRRRACAWAGVALGSPHATNAMPAVAPAASSTNLCGS
jgi:hypothetical protein